MGRWMLMVSLLMLSVVVSAQKESLKSVFEDKFLIGTSVNVWQVRGKDAKALDVLKKHFNAIVAENCMKIGEIHPEEGRYDFEDADAFVRFGEENQMTMIGHCLIWHSQLGPWFCVDKEGNNVSAEVLKARMKEHINTVVTRYKGKIKGWDVVNEAIEDNGDWRNSKFYQILGEEFIPLAFQYAHEADPEVELYYNDYNMFMKGKRDRVVEMVKSMKARGIRIDAVGMQGHLGLDYPSIEDFEESIRSFGDAGVDVMVTEFDMSALPTVYMGANVSNVVKDQKGKNPYPKGLPKSVSKEWNGRMEKFFDLFEKYSEVITRVNMWGISDGDSWKNNFPMRGRTDYPLLFDRQYEPKPFVKALMEGKK